MATTPEMALRAIHDLAAYRLRLETNVGNVFLRTDRVEAIFTQERKPVLSVHILTNASNDLHLSMTEALLQTLREKCGFLDVKAPADYKPE